MGMKDKPLLDLGVPHSAQGGPTPPFSLSPAQPRGPWPPSEIPKTGRPLSQAVLGRVPGCGPRVEPWGQVDPSSGPPAAPRPPLTSRTSSLSTDSSFALRAVKS